MVEPQASRFWSAALQSGLVDVKALTPCWEAIPAVKREALEHLDRRLARQAVQQNVLTLWQAQQLLAGRTTGFRVDRYVLLDLIGQGGMGRVYLARDTLLARRVALKILSSERMTNPRAIARFQREARVGAQLQHENLVRIYDFGVSHGRYFLVMEFIEGKTIGAILTTQGPIPPPTAATLTRQVALGLEHAHRKGLIHRDVNPYNILVTHDGTAKLADLGLAIDLTEVNRLTREGATVGTFDYVAPEQARQSQSVDNRSDIYSLGCSIYHMIAGHVPFPTPSLPEKFFAHQAQEPKPLDEIVPDIAPGLAKVVRKMMRKLPNDRFATPLHVARALEPYIEDQRRPRDIIGQVGRPVPVGPAEPTRILPTPLISPLQADSRVVSPSPSPSPPSPSPSPAGEVQAGALAAVHGSDLASEQPISSSPSVLTSVDDNQIIEKSKENLLFLDPGPKPSLYDIVSQIRAWFGPSKSAKSIGPASSALSESAPIPQAEPGFRAWPRKHRVWGVAALIALLAGLAAGFTLSGWLRSDPGSPANRPRLARQRRSPITVLDANGQETPAWNLAQAMQMAVDSKGWVVLHNREPLLLPPGKESSTLMGTGWLKLRAAPGVSPELVVDIHGQRPFLTVGSKMNLTIEGLTIKVLYGDAYEDQSGIAAPPVILCAGPALLRNCAFEVIGPTAVNNSRAVVADGGNLTVEDCWFKGFQTALDVHASSGATALVRQTMIVPALGPVSEAQPDPSPPIPSGALDWPVWGIRMQSLASGQAGAGRRLVLDHCTVSGTGLLIMDGFTPMSPLEVKATQCAVQTRMLVGWEPGKPEAAAKPQALKWEGHGNQLDISGSFWGILPGRASSGTAQDEIDIDRGGWAKIAAEKEPVAGGIEFEVRSGAAPDSLEPPDFAIKSDGPAKVGADPARVGPDGVPASGPSP